MTIMIKTTDLPNFGQARQGTHLSDSIIGRWHCRGSLPVSPLGGVQNLFRDAVMDEGLVCHRIAHKALVWYMAHDKK